jgi:hypothetical protein
MTSVHAAAEHATQTGNRQGAMAALTLAGKWALEVGEKIGVGLATTAIRDAAIRDAMHHG